MKTTNSTDGIPRRTFLRRALATASCLAAVPTVIPASALGRGGFVAPSERIVLGGIGLGPRGTHVLRWMMAEKDVQFVAVCDPQKSRREAVKRMVDTQYNNTDCAVYREINEFLAARGDIDAVLSATGDRWHALAAILAMRAGKDVYSEKPSSMTIAEGRAVADTAKRYARVYQTGTQRLSEANHVYAMELARTGRLGEVHTAYAQIAPWDEAQMRHDLLPGQPEPSKDECDWDLWLGPCPWRPYNPAYTQGGWRGHYDFHTSCIGEWGAHTFAQAQVGLDLGETCPVEFKYVDNLSGDGMEARFANGLKLVLSRGDKYWHGSCGERFEGTEGWAGAADGYQKTEASSPALLADYEKLIREYQARTNRPMNHVRNFFDCVKSRRTPVANAEMMHRTMSTVHAANICMWLKRDLKYDPEKEEFINDDQANRLRSRAMRAPYTI